MASGTRGKTEESDMNNAFKRQGSLRRVLPPFTTVDAVGNTSIVTSSAAKMIDRPVSSVSDYNSDGTHGGNIKVASHGIEYIVSQEYTIISEYQMLLKREIPGMYVIPSASSSFLWFGILFLREGLYQDGAFRFQVRIPHTYPNSNQPEFAFETPVFHPMVDPKSGLFLHDDAKESESRRLEVTEKVAFGVGGHGANSKHVWQVLLSAQRAMIEVEVKENSLNKDAAEMFINDPDLFAERAAECVKYSLDHINDTPAINDPHYLAFRDYNEEIHEPYRKRLLNPLPKEHSSSSSSSSTKGLSWVQPGTLIPFSKKLTFS